MARGARAGAVAVLLLALLQTGVAQAEDGKVTFEVTMVQATKEDNGADPSLRGLQRWLDESFPGYRSFRSLGRRSETVAQGAAFETRMPDGQTLSLQWLGTDGGFVKVRLSLDGLKTTVRVRDGGLFFQAGRPLKAGGMLVLAIIARSSG